LYRVLQQAYSEAESGECNMKATANEKVVYILGAGFSAQFGLPVMSNFLEKSKDMYAIKDSRNFNGNKIDFFGDVYQEIDKLRRCKDFYASDMTNIEEILSLFEMGKMLGVESKQQIDFQNFIAEVIKYHTPSEFDDSEIDFAPLQKFIKNLFRVGSITGYGNTHYNSELPFYAILTFNYDMLLENALSNYRQKKSENYSAQFIEEKNFSNGKLPYIKLHGAVSDPQTIVTPTWKKAFGDNEASNWKNAGDILSEANHIRIIGYSLPITDSYLKYFLKWGAAHEQNLKSIDVICLDDEQHSVENRYREFIHNKLNFYNKSTSDYLDAVHDGIEDAHQNLFQKSQSPRVQFF